MTTQAPGTDGLPVGVLASPINLDVVAVQRRTLRTLIAIQILAGFGIATGVAVGALLAARMLGSADLAGLVQSSQVLGSALLAVPAAGLSARLGRRAGLTAALGVAAGGGVLALTAAQLQQFWLLAVGMGLFGGGTTATLQARFSAIDLARPERSASTLSLVVWATAIGSVAGPNLFGPGGRLGELVGIEPLAGPLVIGTAAMALAALIAWLGLRPDPLLLARTLPGRAPAAESRRAPRSGLAVIRSSPSARIGLAAVLVGNTAMVTVMVMTPIHMDHGHASLTIIGAVISIHVAGMFAFAPVMGWLSDRFGRLAVTCGGAVTLLAATVLCGTSSHGHSAALTVGLFLLGLGWSATMVAGSTLLSESVPADERLAAQGAADLLMGLAAAGSGALAGFIMGAFGYGALNLAAALLVLPLLAVTWSLRRDLPKIVH
ncbi:MAG TPA: MFS transporter [Jiangellaceae bacterium]